MVALLAAKELWEGTTTREDLRLVLSLLKTAARSLEGTNRPEEKLAWDRLLLLLAQSSSDSSTVQKIEALMLVRGYKHRMSLQALQQVEQMDS